MDTARRRDARHDEGDATDGGVGEATTMPLEGDERRMHVRAYNHWVSLLKGRPYPSIEDLDPAGIADFGPHSVLLDFRSGTGDPAVPFLGRALREECGIDQAISRIAEVPPRSLLSRLTDHYLQIIANRAPIGFEAEFVSTRGLTTLYRGILMPFSSDADQINYVYGVINWKEVADGSIQAQLAAELEAAVRAAPPAGDPPPIWADGPSAGVAPGRLADHLMLARDSAAAAGAAEGRSRAALYRALGRAHDLALAAEGDPAGMATLLEEEGIRPQPRAPMTAIAKLVFGADHDKTRLAEASAVLAMAMREGLAPGALEARLAVHPGGIKAIVRAERLRRRGGDADAAAHEAAPRPALARVALDTGAAPGAPLVLLARVTEDGDVEIVGSVDNPRLVAATERAIG